MRILWLSPWLRPIARLSAEHLRELGVDVMLVTSDLHPESDRARDYETVLLGRPVPTADWLRIAKAYRAAKAFAPDLVVTELLRDPRWRIFGGLAPRIRLVHDDKPHDDTHREPWWIRSFDAWDARASATIVYSEFVAARLASQGVAESSIFVSPLVTDLDAAAVPDFVPADERENFVLVGRQRPYKNHKVIFEAWTAHTRGSAWRGDELVLIGDGQVPHPLPNNVRWERSDFKYRDVVGELARAKGSLVHVRSASQSGVHLLSMQLGVAPIVSTAGALPEYQPPGSPTPIHPDDVIGLTRTFDSLADPIRAEAKGAIALAHYRAHYDTPLAAQRYLEIFHEVVRRS